MSEVTVLDAVTLAVEVAVEVADEVKVVVVSKVPVVLGVVKSQCRYAPV
jgi:hypothetical protein